MRFILTALQSLTMSPGKKAMTGRDLRYCDRPPCVSFAGDESAALCASVEMYMV